MSGAVPCSSPRRRGAARALGRALRARAASYDAVVVHHEELLRLLPDAGPALRVLHVFDVKAERAERTAALASARRSAWVWRAEATAARRTARRWLDRADLVVTCTDADLAALGSIVGGAPQGIVVPNGVDLARVTPAPAPGRARTLFLGSLDYEPNVDGITWFVRDVWPLVRADLPEATLTVAGHRPTAAVRALAAEPGVEVVGPVADVAPVYAEHDVVVVPLRIGTGSRLKALEALAAGRPVAGTSIGVEGLGLTDGAAGTGPAVVADHPAALAGAVRDLLADPSEAASAGRGRAGPRGGHGRVGRDRRDDA